MEKLTDRFDDGKVGVLNILDKGDLIEVTDNAMDGIIYASIQNALERLAEYEDTDISPEEIKDLNGKIRGYKISLEVLTKTLEKVSAECNYWKSDAITATAKLDEIRIWLAENGLDMDEVLDKVTGK